MASCLPKYESSIGSGSPDMLESVLCPVGSVRHLAAKANYEEAPDEQEAGVPWRIGWYWLRGEPSRWTLGEAVKLPDSSKLWRLIEIKGRSVRLLYDLRKEPIFKWVKRDSLSFSWMAWIKWPVYSTRSVAVAVRRTHFAPGDLYLDPRVPGLVRPLSGLEKWRVMGLPAEHAQLLIDKGQGNQLGALAGNSIPASMADAVVKTQAARVAAYQSMTEARDSQSFVLMEPSAWLCAPGACLTVLIPVCMVSSRVMVWGSGLLPGLVSQVNQA